MKGSLLAGVKQLRYFTGLYDLIMGPVVFSVNVRAVAKMLGHPPNMLWAISIDKNPNWNPKVFTNILRSKFLKQMVSKCC